MENCNLLQILESFNAPINEEQAWAICFQIIKFFTSKSFHLAKPSTKDSAENIISLDSIFLTSDGNVLSVLKKDKPEATLNSLSEKSILNSLGVTVFQALDYGLNNSEEQKLSERLEGLIGRMTGGLEGKAEGTESVTGDEGIVDDDDKSDITFKDVLEECHNHIGGDASLNDDGGAEMSVESEVGVHCKAVCRALFHEASELNTFLEQMTSDKELGPIAVEKQDKELCCLERKDWARLWMQVMNELRSGVKLKKVQLKSRGEEGGSYSFELTPYEILMDDVRSKKYKLHKAVSETVGDVYPVKVKKDVHEIILEFIRSRPPLQPVGKRAQVNRHDTSDIRLEPREQLLLAIRNSPPLLRPTPSPQQTSPHPSLHTITHCISQEPVKRIIKPDLNLLSFNDFNEDCDDDEEEDEDDEEKMNTNKMNGDVDDDVDDMRKSRVRTSESTFLEPLNPPSHPLHLPWQHAEKQSSFFFPKPSEPSSSSSSSSLHPSSSSSSLSYYNHTSMACYNKNFEMVMTGSDTIKSLPPSTNCLSLTIEEIMHIRTVLTKAELECLSAQPNLYNLLESGKVCFTCKKVKFSLLFGPWPQKCKFCSRSVCSQCSSKMRIPTEHFEHIPVYTLNPCSTSPMHSFEQDCIETSCGSAPSSPDRKTCRQSTKHYAPKQEEEGMLDRLSSKLSTPSLLSSFQNKRSMLRKADSVASKTCSNCNVSDKMSLLPGGPLMTVCCECREMVLSIVRASRRCLAMMQRKDTASRSERAYSACPPSRKNFPLSTPHSITTNSKQQFNQF